MNKRYGAFTLIELMVVVAIIAILSSMGVANFSTAIKKARNAVRQTDVKAVSTALETCFNIMTGSYGFHTTVPGGTTTYTAMTYNITAGTVPAAAHGVFNGDPNAATQDANRCLQAGVAPKLASYPYQFRAFFDNDTGREYYIVCAKLEDVGGVENLGNYTTTGDDLPAAGDWVRDFAPIACTDVTNCWFCVNNQQ